MILVCKAVYEALRDSIHVTTLIQDDDQTSLAKSLQQGTVEILQGDTASFTENFYAEHRVLWPNDDGVMEDLGYFYFFFHHPQAQRYLSARVTVNLSDGRSATQTVPVALDQEPEADAWQNPALTSRVENAFEEDVNLP